MSARSAAVVVLVLCCLLPAVCRAQASPYTIHPGDQLQIVVFGVSALSETVTVLSDGTITVPLVGSLEVAGLQPDQATQRLKEAVAAFVRNPVVSVLVAKGTPDTVEVLGSVDHNGPIEIQSGDRLVDALARAGVGPTTHADLNHITLNRLVDGVPHLYNVNVYNMLLNGDYASNMTLRPGDVVYVPKARQYSLNLLPASLFYLYLIGTGYRY